MCRRSGGAGKGGESAQSRCSLPHLGASGAVWRPLFEILPALGVSHFSATRRRLRHAAALRSAGSENRVVYPFCTHQNSGNVVR